MCVRVERSNSKVVPEASLQKVADMRDDLKKARSGSDLEKMMSLLRELSGMKVSLESMTGTRLQNCRKRFNGTHECANFQNVYMKLLCLRFGLASVLRNN